MDAATPMSSRLSSAPPAAPPPSSAALPTLVTAAGTTAAVPQSDVVVDAVRDAGIAPQEADRRVPRGAEGAGGAALPLGQVDRARHEPQPAARRSCTAIKKGRRDKLVELLIDSGEGVNTKVPAAAMAAVHKGGDYGEVTPLIHAVHHENVQMVRRRVRRGHRSLQHGDERAAQSRRSRRQRSRCCSRTRCSATSSSCCRRSARSATSPSRAAARGRPRRSRASARVSALTGSRQNTPRGRWSSPPDTL